jgi:hypothetical protein
MRPKYLGARAGANGSSLQSISSHIRTGRGRRRLEGGTSLKGELKRQDSGKNQGKGKGDNLAAPGRSWTEIWHGVLPKVEVLETG